VAVHIDTFVDHDSRSHSRTATCRPTPTPVSKTGVSSHSRSPLIEGRARTAFETRRSATRCRRWPTCRQPHG